MAEESAPRENKPPCYKCKGATSFYNRVLYPNSSKTYELYDCADCGVITSRVVDTE